MRFDNLNKPKNSQDPKKNALFFCVCLIKGLRQRRGFFHSRPKPNVNLCTNKFITFSIKTKNKKNKQYKAKRLYTISASAGGRET